MGLLKTKMGAKKQKAYFFNFQDFILVKKVCIFSLLWGFRGLRALDS